jgi:hypothetical protein
MNLLVKKPLYEPALWLENPSVSSPGLISPLSFPKLLGFWQSGYDAHKTAAAK